MAETTMKIPKGGKVVVQGEEADVLPQDVDQSNPDQIPLFPQYGKPNQPVRIAVTRLDPPDGYLGEVPAHINEEGIKRLFGGRVLQLDMRNERGVYLKGGQRVLTIDAPPVSRRNEGSVPDSTAALLALQSNIFERSNTLQASALKEANVSQREQHASQMADREAAHKEALERERNWHTQTMQEERLRAEARAKEAREQHQQAMERLAQERETERERSREHTAMLLTMMTNANTTMLQATNRMTEVLITAITSRSQNELGFAQMLELMDRFGGRDTADPAVEALKAFGSNVGGYLDLAKTQEMRKLKELAVKNPEKAKELYEKFIASRKGNGGNGASNGAPKANVKTHDPLPAPGAANAKALPPSSKVLTPERLAKVEKLLATLDVANIDVDFVLDDTLKNAERMAKENPGDDDEQGEDDAIEDSTGNGQTPANANPVANGA